MYGIPNCRILLILTAGSFPNTVFTQSRMALCMVFFLIYFELFSFGCVFWLDYSLCILQTDIQIKTYFKTATISSVRQLLCDMRKGMVVAHSETLIPYATFN